MQIIEGYRVDPADVSEYTWGVYTVRDDERFPLPLMLFAKESEADRMALFLTGSEELRDVLCLTPPGGLEFEGSFIVEMLP